MPVILTAKDDNNQGDLITGSTGAPGTTYYAGVALNFTRHDAGTDIVLQHLRVLNAKTAVGISVRSNLVLSDVQMVNCGYGVAATNTTFSLWNGLMVGVRTNFTGSSATGDVEHLTADTASLLNNSLTLNVINSLLVSVTIRPISGSNCIYSAFSGTGIFQTVGGGSTIWCNPTPMSSVPSTR